MSWCEQLWDQLSRQMTEPSSGINGGRGADAELVIASDAVGIYLEQLSRVSWRPLIWFHLQTRTQKITWCLHRTEHKIYTLVRTAEANSCVTHSHVTPIFAVGHAPYRHVTFALLLKLSDNQSERLPLASGYIVL